MKLFYISFATETNFLGATVVEADSSTCAMIRASMLNLNPGGQAAIIAIPDKLSDAPDIAPLLNKLLNKEEMIALGAQRHADLSDDLQAKFEAHADVYQL
jgi:hypothetical protein